MFGKEKHWFMKIWAISSYSIVNNHYKILIITTEITTRKMLKSFTFYLHCYWRKDVYKLREYMIFFCFIFSYFSVDKLKN